MAKVKKITKKELLKKLHDYAGTPKSINSSVSKEIRYRLAPLKEHVMIYMWETFIKSELYRAKLMGITPHEMVDFMLEDDETIIAFGDWCGGYAEGVRESKENQN